MQELERALKEACQKLFQTEIEPEITRPDEKFGDYATNIAMQLAKKSAATPRQIAERLADELQDLPGIKEIGIAGPGFINFTLTDEALQKAAAAAADLPRPLQGQEILVEFGDPNPFKEMHIGHAYSYIVGDAISSLLEASGAKVERLSYHGDVGLHVAKAIWSMRQAEINRSDPTSLAIGSYYAQGSKAYEQNQSARREIDQVNQKIYDRTDSEINELYEWGKEQSFKYFDDILKNLQIKSDHRFLESKSAEKGLGLVKQHPEVFEQSDGAIVYKGEKAGLHTRVFITSAGLPTYETKDLGLAELKKEAYPKAGKSIIITAHEQAEYFKVMLAALSEFDPATADMTKHLYHGFVSLSSGKMSSRTGEVYGAVDLIDDVDEAVRKVFKKENASTRNAAIKYAFLKNRLGSDIVYDIGESVSLEGSSGPYLQYAYARACSILAKAGGETGQAPIDLNAGERSLARKIGEYPEVVAKAAGELMPHHICTYLYELAQVFNSFYEKSRIIGDEREAVRLALVKSYSQILKSGLNILNIEAPERI